MKGIVLLSGGLDSTLVLLKLLKEGHKVVPMFVDYNQWPVEGEMSAVVDIIDWASHPHTWNISLLSKPGLYLGELACIMGRVGDEKVGSVWGRSIALVGLAAMWAYTHGNDYEFIALGSHKGDLAPDIKPGQFDASLHDSLLEGTKGQLDLVLPIRDLTVEDIGKELAIFGRDLFDLTYSCYWTPSCQFRSPNDSYLCPGCRRKVVAMEAAAKTDTGLYEYFQQRLFRLPNCRERTYQSSEAESTGY